ncbi:MAG: carbamoyl phosphate synthase large subunit [Spirochaetes bacterium GWB1_36_13]|nr:MAG: carbamoyl phosphate synthase large subunit [Spirochaetes bacterium GWB1_36_13]
MPKRTDIHKILIIGAGPIIIGQACEFDYSGSQACKALREEGYEVVLINSNPATIMTDPDLADRTYIEPMTPEIVEKIIAKERPDAILPTLGGQTGLNLAVKLAKLGILKKYSVEMIGANLESIEKAESRELFKAAMNKINAPVPKSFHIYSLEEAMKIISEIGYPAILRASFTLGGSGGSIAYNEEQYIDLVKKGIDESPVNEILVEESILGWKEYELEVMRDKKDNVVIVCSIENFDPMGVHTGDSITVAPIQTLTDREYQVMRDMAVKIIREIGVETGGSNIQFAIHPKDGRMIVIEMNPRVSRSSALASKATGFPIAKIAAKLAVGYTLDEIPNDITRETPASFEPTLDYCVLKFPRWNFEKFPQANPVLGVQMKSVGEAMSIGRTFKETLNKALRSLEIGVMGFESKGKEFSNEELEKNIRMPNPERIFYLKEAFERNYTVEKLYEISAIDPWFLNQLKEIHDFEQKLKKDIQKYDYQLMVQAKQYGFSDFYIAKLTGTTENEVRNIRNTLGILPTYKLVDTCAAEFEAKTPYYYSTYESEDESNPSDRKKVIILGGGPNRIGQGIEFDYMCVHASMALRDMGYESIMVNSNPETVSTDYDTSDKLYFEPITFEDVMNIYERENPLGVIVQLGGQTPLNLVKKLEAAGVPILGTSPTAIDIAEDRKLFKTLLEKLNLKQPENDTAVSWEEAFQIANKIGYPVVVRPSYVLGGRSMEIVFSDQELEFYMKKALIASPEKPILIDRFLEDAIEVDVDCVSDGNDTVIAGIMQHIEEAGVHSGDSCCFLPHLNLQKKIIDEIKEATYKLAAELKIIGLMNIQYAVKQDTLYILEVNPRGSRTTPFVCKATGVAWVKTATALMVGKTIKELNVEEVIPKYYSVKEVVLPFNKFPEVDTILGPEMKSTGEVMGIDHDPGLAFAKAQIASGSALPTSGNLLITLNDYTKPKTLDSIKKMEKMGFKIFATSGTYDFLTKNKIQAEKVLKIHEGSPNIADLIKSNQVQLIFNTPLGQDARKDDKIIRQSAVRYRIPIVTTVSAIQASAEGIASLLKNKIEVKSIQECYQENQRGEK